MLQFQRHSQAHSLPVASRSHSKRMASDDQLRQALAIALVQRRRGCAEVDKWRARTAQLELKLEARRLPTLEHPLQLLARLEPGLEEPADQAGELGAAALWQQAAACLPDQRGVLDLLQRQANVGRRRRLAGGGAWGQPL